MTSESTKLARCTQINVPPNTHTNGIIFVSSFETESLCRPGSPRTHQTGLNPQRSSYLFYPEFWDKGIHHHAQQRSPSLYLPSAEIKGV